MKRVPLSSTIILFLLTLALTANSQYSDMGTANFKCIYSLKWQEDSLNPYNLREEKLVLITGKDYSLFNSYGNYFLDSVLISNPNTNFETFRQLNAPRRFAQRYQILKDFNNEKITTADRVFSDVFIYTEPKSIIKWRLTDEWGEFKGYKVQKATTSLGGRYWEAWFTQDIPISDGPYKFSGLPGLILQVRDSRDHYTFEIEAIHPTNENIYYRNTSSYFKTSKAYFLEVQKKFNQDAASSILSSGVPLHQSQNADLKLIEDNLRRRNNPIELTAD